MNLNEALKLAKQLKMTNPEPKLLDKKVYSEEIDVKELLSKYLSRDDLYEYLNPIKNAMIEIISEDQIQNLVIDATEFYSSFPDEPVKYHLRAKYQVYETDKEFIRRVEKENDRYKKSIMTKEEKRDIILEKKIKTLEKELFKLKTRKK